MCFLCKEWAKPMQATISQASYFHMRMRTQLQIGYQTF